MAERRPTITPRSLYVPHDGRRLHLLDWAGDERGSTTVLCVHGGCANAHWWCGSARLLAGCYRILALDLTGHGDSDHLASGDYSLAGHRDDLVHVVRHLDLRGFALVAHSFGAFVSLAAVPQLIDRLGTLTLVDSRGHIRERAARYLTALSKFPNPSYASRDEAQGAFQLLPRESSASAEVLRHVARHSIRGGSDGTWSLAFDRRALRAATIRDFTAEMNQLRQPTLLVRGAASGALSPRALQQLAAEIPHAEAIEIAGAHHHVMLDRPGPFAQALDSFLQRSGAGPSGGRGVDAPDAAG
jgi:pimeloyl-ACP methyl ester carboxylesterase